MMVQSLRAYIPDLRFIKNYNQKLGCKFFSTIRIATQKNIGKFKYGLGKQFNIRVGGVSRCYARLLSIEFMKIKNMPDYLFYLDAACGRDEFIELMAKFYGKNKAWKDEETECMLMIFER